MTSQTSTSTKFCYFLTRPNFRRNTTRFPHLRFVTRVIFWNADTWKAVLQVVSISALPFFQLNRDTSNLSAWSHFANPSPFSPDLRFWPCFLSSLVLISIGYEVWSLLSGDRQISFRSLEACLNRNRIHCRVEAIIIATLGWLVCL